MKIQCDGCAKEIPKETALVREIDGEVVHFCSIECEARRRIVEPVLQEEEERLEPGGEAWG